MKVEGRLIARLLGEEHIEDDTIVFAEQVKNAIDAYAEKIRIDFSNYNGNQQIIIEDDGDGMAKYEIENYWNSVASSHKSNDLQALGGKGIGRFTLFRLADKITIYTKKENGPCYKITMDREELNNVDDLNSYDFDYTESTINKIGNKGTYIVLDNAKLLSFKDLQISLETLFLPFKDKPIIIDIKYPDEFKKIEFFTPDTAIKDALMYIEGEFNNGKWQNVYFISKIKNDIFRKELSLSSETDNHLQKLINQEDLPIQNFSEKLNDLGKIKIKIYNFVLATNILKFMDISKKDIQNKFLIAYQGINIYRSDCKIFGHGLNDWLKLAEKRLMHSADNIDNKTAFGYVELSDVNKELLVEKTNREGFIKNDYSKLLDKIILSITSELGKMRKETLAEIKLLDSKYISDQIKKIKDLKLPKKDYLHPEEEIQQYVDEQLTSSFGENHKLIAKVNISKFSKENIGKQLVPIDIYQRDNQNNPVIQFKLTVQPKITIKTNKEAIFYINSSIIDTVKSDKLKWIIKEELMQLDYMRFPIATSLTLRALIEITFNLYIKKYLETNPSDSDKNKFYYSNTAGEILNKSTNKTIKTEDRINIVKRACRINRVLSEEKIIMLLRDESSGKDGIIANFINEANFTTHKSYFMINSITIKQFWVASSDFLIKLWTLL